MIDSDSGYYQCYQSYFEATHLKDYADRQVIKSVFR